MHKNLILLILILVVLFTAGFLYAQTQDLVIEPETATLRQNSDDEIQFQAFYNGRDVTDEANWVIQAYSSDDLRLLEELGPGHYKAGTQSGTIGIRASYGQSSDLVNVTVEFTGERQILYIKPVSPEVGVGEEITFSGIYDPNSCSQIGIIGGCPDVENVTGRATWSSGDFSILEKVSGSTFRGKRAGTANINLTYSGKTVSKQVQVTTDVPGDPEIDTSQYDVVFEKTLIDNRGDYAFSNSPNFSYIEEVGNHYVVTTSQCPRSNFFGYPSGLVLDSNADRTGSFGFCSDAEAGTDDSHADQIGGRTNIYDDNFLIYSGSRVTGLGINRPPKSYKFENGRASFFSSTYNAKDYAGINRKYPIDTIPIVSMMDSMAVVGNKAIILGWDPSEARDGASREFYWYVLSVPDMTILDKVSRVDRVDENSGLRLAFPIAGLGDYFFTRFATGNLALYKLNSDNSFKFVRDISSDPIAAFELDPGEVTFLFGTDNYYRLETYRETSNEPFLVTSKELNTPNLRGRVQIAKEGDLVAVAVASPSSDSTPTLLVWNGDRQLSVGPLPEEKVGEGDSTERITRFGGVEILPNSNKLVVTTYQAIHVFEIKDQLGTAPDTPTTLSTEGLSLQYFLDITNSFMDSIRNIFGFSTESIENINSPSYTPGVRGASIDISDSLLNQINQGLQSLYTTGFGLIE